MFAICFVKTVIAAILTWRFGDMKFNYVEHMQEKMHVYETEISDKHKTNKMDI